MAGKIKLIATDMDGTWLRDDQTYDRQIFKREFRLMEKQGVVFVVASGDQFAKIAHYFPEEKDRISFIAENGALLARGRKVLEYKELGSKSMSQISRIARDYNYPMIFEGLRAAYVRKSDGPDYYREMTKYYQILRSVDSFADANDKILKANMLTPESETLGLVDRLRAEYPDLQFVTGAANAIDIQVPGVSKGSCLRDLAKDLGIRPEEVVAFGDSGNDAGMLRFAGRSFATSTALAEAKQAAGGVIGSCNDGAVQKKIMELLKEN